MSIASRRCLLSRLVCRKDDTAARWPFSGVCLMARERDSHHHCRMSMDSRKVPDVAACRVGDPWGAMHIVRIHLREYRVSCSRLLNERGDRTSSRCRVPTEVVEDQGAATYPFQVQPGT